MKNMFFIITGIVGALCLFFFFFYIKIDYKLSILFLMNFVLFLAFTYIEILKDIIKCQAEIITYDKELETAYKEKDKIQNEIITELTEKIKEYETNSNKDSRTD